MRRLALALLLCTPALADDPATRSPAEAPEDAPPQVDVRVEGPLRFEDIPPVDPALVTDLLRYQALRGASHQGFSAGDGLYVRTRFGDVSQIHRVERPGGARTQLTFGAEPVAGVSAHPTRPDLVAFSRDIGGNEAYQNWLLDLGTGAETLLTDGTHRHGGVVWSHDGQRMAWTGTARNGTDYDVYVRDLDGTEATRVFEGEGYWYLTDWSDDGATMVLGHYISSTRSELWRLDLATGNKVRLSPEGEVSIAGGALLDDGSVLLVSDHEGEFLKLYRASPDGSALTPLATSLEWNVEDLAVSPDGRTVAVAVNERGWSKLYLLDLKKGRLRPAEGLPDARITGLTFDPDDPRTLGLTLYGPNLQADAWTLDVRKGKATRWTRSETGGLDVGTFVAPELVTWTSFDGLELDGLLYKPVGQGPFPVVVSIHGGPEGQSRPTLSGLTQVLVRDHGIAVLEPNVRGSRGYGKSFLKLDNGMKREDSVKDIGALLDWVAAEPSLDGERVAVRGGSYGGYMVLASLVHFGDRLVAGIDNVGISNFVTFLENTKAYRRDLRRVEYGDERDPEMRAHLQAISPVSRADAIQSRLFVIHGANDPRVPVGEAEQIVAAARANGQDVWYLRAENEGHGFRKKANRDVATALQVTFLVDALK